jgi:hypothetical protein
MKKWISILAGLLVAQLVVAVAVNLTEQDYGAFVAKEKLLGLEQQKVDRLLIEGGEGAVTLNQSSSQWVLPDEGDFPVAPNSVEALLEKLASLEKGWPVATTTSASRRFKVAEDEYERKLTLYSGDEVVGRLYVGTSPGFRKVHLRPDDEEAVFVAEFNAWEVDAQADGWIDKEVLKLDQAELEKIRLTGEITLLNEQGEMQLEGLQAQESTNLEETRNLISKLSDLRIQSLIGEEESAAYKEKEPELDILVMLKDGKELSYQFFKVEGESHYSLKRSDRDRYFEVASQMVDPFKEVSREKLIIAKESQSEAAPEIKTSQNEIEQN